MVIKKTTPPPQKKIPKNQNTKKTQANNPPKTPQNKANASWMCSEKKNQIKKQI